MSDMIMHILHHAPTCTSTFTERHVCHVVSSHVLLNVIPDQLLRSILVAYCVLKLLLLHLLHS